MTTQNKIAAAVIDAIKTENHFDILGSEIVRLEKSRETPFAFSVSYQTIGSIGLCYPSDVALRLGGRVSGGGSGDRRMRLHFTDTYKLEKFFSVVNDMLDYQERINNKFSK